MARPPAPARRRVRGRFCSASGVTVLFLTAVLWRGRTGPRSARALWPRRTLWRRSLRRCFAGVSAGVGLVPRPAGGCLCVGGGAYACGGREAGGVGLGGLSMVVGSWGRDVDFCCCCCCSGGIGGRKGAWAGRRSCRRWKGMLSLRRMGRMNHHYRCHRRHYCWYLRPDCVVCCCSR